MPMSIEIMVSLFYCKLQINLNYIPIDFNLTFLIFDPSVLTGISTSKIDPQVVDIWMPDMIWILLNY